jgi:hypothetical protein
VLNISSHILRTVSEAFSAAGPAEIVVVSSYFPESSLPFNYLDLCNEIDVDHISLFGHDAITIDLHISLPIGNAMNMRTVFPACARH